MAHGDSSTNLNLDTDKLAGRPSAGATAHLTSDADDVTKSADEKVDRVALESATRAQKRIHTDEENTPGNTLFTK